MNEKEQRLAELEAIYASLHAQVPQVEERWVWVYGSEVATIKVLPRA